MARNKDNSELIITKIDSEQIIAPTCSVILDVECLSKLKPVPHQMCGW